MALTPLFSSNRRFVLASYQHSHGLLLFRSLKGTGGAVTRLDVLFQDVRAVELRMWTDGLSITEVEAASLADRPSRPAALIEPGNRVYSLAGDGWDGFVVGGIISIAEHDKEDWDPSLPCGGEGTG